MAVDDHEVIEAMRTFGGSFIKALAEAWLRGDPINRLKIQHNWINEWSEYAAVATLRRASLDAQER